MDKLERIKKAKQIAEKVEELSTIPAVATQVLRLLDQPDINTEEITDLMLSDQVMTARVLKPINSPVYSPAYKTTPLKTALVSLGLDDIREMALTTSLIQAFEKEPGIFEVDIFWEQALGVGMASKIITSKIGYADPEKAYTAGIIHNLGIAPLNTRMAPEFQEILSTIKDKPISMRNTEIERFGTSHCEIGLCIAEKWNFPEVYCDVIAHHHFTL